MVFYAFSIVAPWCGHCKNLQPHWNSVATRLKGKVKFAKVDATAEKNLAQKYGISGFPTIKIFPPHGPIDSPQSYDGGRTVDAIEAAAMELLKKYPIKREILQLVNQDLLEKECVSKNGICVIVFLPHILDTKAEGRKQLIKVLEEGAKTAINFPYSFFWAQAYDHKELEKAMNLGSGYPTVVAISHSKKKFGVMRMAYTEKSVTEFLRDLMRGYERLSEFKELPKANNIEKWDGKDPVQSDL